MLSSIIGGLVIGIALLVTFILGDRKGFNRGIRRGAEEMNSYIMEKYSGYVMLSKEGFRDLSGYSVEEYQMMQDMLGMEEELKEEYKSKSKVSHLNVVKDEKRPPTD